MSAHMDQLIAQFENFQAKVRQAEASFAGVGDMQERIAQVENSVTSPDGTVTVVAGAGGTVTGIRLAPGAVRLGSDQLAATIMKTLRQAVAGAVQQQAGIVDTTFGDAFGVNLSDQVREAQAEAFGTAAEEPASTPQAPAPQAQPRKRRPGPPDDDDYFDQNILRR
ncbi:YbaB/EbfC family nucleoid-associated protein [Amycolatopsis alkalitolerans]|uniref:YbaB/EbfC family nucleoid-associated protein n=1 Tax=Amycolatopsis alkalitolerans TaxID=2547244 RepID=A0A5C4LUA3_9PSEU|nr:YbaB/EbfC family nucleoid-associated protein [Amycolatopsis alkalitolerans]TNC22765.1 YbaB/EbfC family nucleoid-associated protein [Amycolatopsis alkalitolerans]